MRVAYPSPLQGYYVTDGSTYTNHHFVERAVIHCGSERSFIHDDEILRYAGDFIAKQYAFVMHSAFPFGQNHTSGTFFPFGENRDDQEVVLLVIATIDRDD
jgi:hypothetical protein